MAEPAVAQRATVDALCRSLGAQLIETHISYVLLAGAQAWKIKKALDLGFADFRTLAQRRFYCDEELRLNRRTAPQMYLQVLPLTGTPLAADARRRWHGHRLGAAHVRLRAGRAVGPPGGAAAAWVRCRSTP